MAEEQKKDDFEFEVEGEDKGKPVEKEVEAKGNPKLTLKLRTIRRRKTEAGRHFPRKLSKN